MDNAQLKGCKVVSDETARCLPLDPFGMYLKSTVTAVNLPLDPFGMDLKSTVTAVNLPLDSSGMNIKTTITTTKDWIQDLDDDFETIFKEYWFCEDKNDITDAKLLAGPECSSATKFQPEKGNLNFGAMSIHNHSRDDFLVDDELKNVGFDFKNNIPNWAVCDIGKELQDEGGDPNDALFFALAYLEVEDLLVVERVCRSLRDAIRSDSLLWRSIHIYYPLCIRITDESLLKLTGRAQGTLKCLSLMQCIHITCNGLKQVLENNPRLTKLCVPGCVRLHFATILQHLRFLKSSGTLRIKHLRIGRIGMLGVTKQQFEELKSILGVNSPTMLKANKPQFYGWRHQPYLLCNDGRPLDIEICPKCQAGKIVYDCPAESCKGKDTTNQSCRACSSCIARCSICGRCIKEDYCLKEKLRGTLVCLICDTSPSGNTSVSAERRYKFCFLQ